MAQRDHLVGNIHNQLVLASARDEFILAQLQLVNPIVPLGHAVMKQALPLAGVIMLWLGVLRVMENFIFYEPLLRLNLEALSEELMERKRDEVLEVTVPDEVFAELDGQRRDVPLDLSREIVEKWSRRRPRTVGEASRISGVTPAAVSLSLSAGFHHVSGDGRRLLQVLWNVINNAVDAMLEHEQGGTLSVKGYAQTGHVCIEFRDSGPGIREPKKVFDPFYTTKSVGKGTGLGLSIVKEVVQQMGGSVGFANALGGGAPAN